MGAGSITYRADIDGLRAIAVLLVLFNHAKLGFRGGYVGVDVFFVISGYLITGIMVRELEQNRFSLVGFWERRIRRIWPAMTAMVLAVLIAGYLCLLPYDLVALGRSALMQAALMANIFFWGDSGYFESAANEKPLLHHWSLAVEEQFYLFLPFLLMGLYGWLQGKGGGVRAVETRILKALAAIGAASLLLASVGVFFDSNTAFYWLPHRAWELLTGACLACIPPSWYPAAAQRTMVKWAGWCGLVMILVSGLVYRETTIFPGLAALPPCLGAVAIIWANLGANQQLSGVGRLLSRKPLVMIGLSSYSLYLWHWPLFAFARYLAADSDEGLSVGLRWGIIGASILLAFGSLCLIETPVRKKYILKSRKAVLGFGLVSSLGCGALAYGLVQSQGMPERVSSQARAYAEAKFDIPGNWSATWVTVADAQQGRFKVIGKARDDQPPAIMLWGDSHARCLIPAFENWCDSRGIYGVAAVHNTLSPTLGYYRKAKTGLNEKALLFGDAVLEHVRSQRIRHTVVTAYWQKCAQRDPHAFSEALKRTAQAFKEAGSELTVILDVPAQKFDVPKALALSAWLPAFPDPRQEVVSVIKHREANQIMYELKPELEKMRIRVLDPLPLLSERHDEEGAAAETTLIAAEGASLYFDRHHVSRMGALRIAPLLAPLFEGSSGKLVRKCLDDGKRSQ